MGGSASWRRSHGRRSRHAVASLEVAANGMIANSQEGRHEREERREVETPVARPGREQVFLEEELHAVGEVWKGRTGRRVFGPMRFCMSPTTLRSNQIMSMVATSRNGEDQHDLEQHDQHDGEVDVAAEERGHLRTSGSPPDRTDRTRVVAATGAADRPSHRTPVGRAQSDREHGAHEAVSMRQPVTGDVGIDEVGDADLGLVEHDGRRPAGRPGVGVDRQRDRRAGRAHDHAVADGHAEAVGSRTG